MKLALKPTAALALLGCTAQPAYAADPACITPAEARAAIVKLAPAALQGVRSKCGPVLPKLAYLNLQGAALSTRLAAPRLADPAALQSLVGKLKPGGLPAVLDNALIDIAVSTVVTRIQQDLKIVSCPTIDQSLALLDPLPTENLIGVIQIIATQAAIDDANKRRTAGKSVGVTLCSSPS